MLITTSGGSCAWGLRLSAKKSLLLSRCSMEAQWCAGEATKYTPPLEITDRVMPLTFVGL